MLEGDGGVGARADEGGVGVIGHSVLERVAVDVVDLGRLGGLSVERNPAFVLVSRLCKRVRLKNAPRHVGVNHNDHVGLSDEGVRGLAESDARVHRVVEGNIDGRKAGGEDGDGEEVDELDELGNGSEVATEVGGDDEGFLGCREGRMVNGLNGLKEKTTHTLDEAGADSLDRCREKSARARRIAKEQDALDLLRGESSMGDQC